MGICGDIAGLQAADGKVGAVGAPCPQHACTQGQPRHTDGHTQRCVAHKDIKVRQALCPPYAAVAHGSVPHDLLQGRLCYIKFPMEPLSSLDGLAGGHQQV